MCYRLRKKFLRIKKRYHLDSGVSFYIIQVYSQLYGPDCHSAGECRDQRGFCCKSDLCNRDTPSQKASRDLHTQKGNIDKNRVTKRNNSGTKNYSSQVLFHFVDILYNVTLNTYLQFLSLIFKMTLCVMMSILVPVI